MADAKTRGTQDPDFSDIVAKLIQRVAVLEKEVADLKARVVGNATSGFEAVTIRVENAQQVKGRGLVVNISFPGPRGRLYPEDVLQGSDGGQWQISGIEMLQGPVRPIDRTLGLILTELKAGDLQTGTTLTKVRGRA